MRFFISGDSLNSVSKASYDRSFVIISPKEKDKIELISIKEGSEKIENNEEKIPISERLIKTGGSNTSNKLNTIKLNKKNAAFLRALKVDQDSKGSRNSFYLNYFKCNST